MKLYWSDPTGQHPPENASFFILPFGLKKTPIPLKNMTRIYHLPAPLSSLQKIKQENIPSSKTFQSSVLKTLKKIQDGSLQKAVLARKCSIECASHIDPLKLVSFLKDNAENSTLFCLCNETSAFVGATPESLFTRDKNQISVEALAGTAPRGKTQKEDLLLEKELLASETKRQEILLVQSFIQEAITPFCLEKPLFFPLTIKKTKYVQHLHATAHATLKENISDLDLAIALHPTPALSGTPQKKALAWIASQEPFERGLYGGVIGWSTQDAAHWVVAIRCALIENTKLHLYTGCGIVQGADPNQEWEELNHKMRLYDTLFS